MRSINKGENTMSSKQPSHRAFVVTEGRPGTNQKGYWHPVGAVWPHKSGKGFDLVIPEGISVTGRIVCTEPKIDEATE
jgi:type IV secretory pathway TraG/TraD family ATPase VirD4